MLMSMKYMSMEIDEGVFARMLVCECVRVNVCE